MHATLLIGAGSSRRKLADIDDREGWGDLVTLDLNPDHHPDVVHDLNEVPLPFEDERFDEIHAYEVLEHCGTQGDWRYFFAQWSDFYRLLKPGGVVVATVPAPGSPWVWGDPSHTRHIPPESLVFLNQPAYAAQVGVTPMSDFRHVFRGDFDVVHSQVTSDGMSFVFIVRAVKPSRIGGVQ